MLYRRHTKARQVPASDRFPEGGDGANATTYADTTAQLSLQGVDNDSATTGRQADGAVSEDAYSADELRDMAGELGLSKSGSKAELVERINTKLAEQGE